MFLKTRMESIKIGYQDTIVNLRSWNPCVRIGDHHGNWCKGFFLNQKSHTCEKGGAHHRTYFWHFFMNLKSNYLFKKLLKWANKKYKNFNTYNNAVFFKNNKEKHLEIILFYTCLPNILMIWSIGIEHDRLKLVILCHFCPFTPLETKKKKKKTDFWKNEKKGGDINSSKKKRGFCDISCHFQQPCEWHFLTYFKKIIFKI